MFVFEACQNVDEKEQEDHKHEYQEITNNISKLVNFIVQINF